MHIYKCATLLDISVGDLELQLFVSITNNLTKYLFIFLQSWNVIFRSSPDHQVNNVYNISWVKGYHLETQHWYVGLILVVWLSHDPRDHSGYGLSQWTMMLHCITVSHWLRPLSPYPEWSLNPITNFGLSKKNKKKQWNLNLFTKFLHGKHKVLKYIFDICTELYFVYLHFFAQHASVPAWDWWAMGYVVLIM